MIKITLPVVQYYGSECCGIDCLRLTFDIIEEIIAFTKVVDRITHVAGLVRKSAKVGKYPFNTEYEFGEDGDDKMHMRGVFDTSFEYELAKERIDDLKRIIPYVDDIVIKNKDHVIIDYGFSDA